MSGGLALISSVVKDLGSVTLASDLLTFPGKLGVHDKK
jgi:hypothetical protein